ncbi:MAG: bacillithiol biosynthesis cysteine-adding enzyme BshC [Flavipsychrobacter sp.]|nr:bacillithiol biosynthesis cysteine-adding enzyme BshC [Flavipsychrobacter sp.]
MEPACTYLPYERTGYFSRLVTDYLAAQDDLKPFYTFSPDKEGILDAVRQRQGFPVDRALLADVLQSQYRNLARHERVDRNLALLANENTYTVCTAHQPNLLTGYLYFIYKILHAIKLAEDLQAECPGKNFVPVYYMGSEDNDLAELGTFRYEGRRFVWDGAGQAGAVGRMKPEGLEALLAELFRIMGPPGEHFTELKNILTQAYLHHDTIASATQYLVNELFGRFGLIVLNPDDRRLKAAFAPVMKDDVLHHSAYGIVSAEVQKLEANYRSQAYPRPINLFYLADNTRERIEKSGDKWVVLNTAISFTEQQLLQAIDETPEMFSPNVILRGLYQETILPNVAFIGGGAEVAYWMQLRGLFSHYGVFYPAIQLRQSVLWVPGSAVRLRRQLGLTTADVFLPEAQLVKKYMATQATAPWQTDAESAEMEAILHRLRQKAAAVDPTLAASAGAAFARIQHQLQVLEKKMLRAEKRKMEVQLARISRLRAALFPGGTLQERVDNFAAYYLQQGPAFLNVLKEAIRPFHPAFLVLEEEG